MNLFLNYRRKKDEAKYLFLNYLRNKDKAKYLLLNYRRNEDEAKFLFPNYRSNKDEAKYLFLNYLRNEDDAKYSFLNYLRNEDKAKYSFLNYRWFAIANWQGPYTDRIYLWFKAFLVKEIRGVIEWLQEIKTADQWEQHCCKILLIYSKINMFAQCKLIINGVEIIACKLELFKNPTTDFINQEISAERERSPTWLLQLCLRHKETKLWSMPIRNPDSEYLPRVPRYYTERRKTQRNIRMIDILTDSWGKAIYIFLLGVKGYGGGGVGGGGSMDRKRRKHNFQNQAFPESEN
jgi:hypothetical protein